jgi:thiol-disulfide isomerase/thioredoxin
MSAVSSNQANPERAPEFARGEWLNTDRPLRMSDLRGSAVLVDMWDYTSVNCLRTLPYIQEWHARYAAKGLVVVGVHTPEFAFGRERTQVELAVEELGIRYPVLLDNDYATWNAYQNLFWPSRYLIDAKGIIRCRHYGEGGYDELEQAIQTVLREIDSNLDLPPVMTPPHPEDQQKTLDYRPTPALRGGFNRGALGNPEGYAGGVPIFYTLPGQRRIGAFYVGGAWQAGSQYMTYRGREEGLILVPYEAAEVNAILSPHVDVVERMLNPQPASVEIWQDDSPLHEERRGADVTEDGRLLVNRPRLYNLIRNPGFERHELALRVKSQGFTLYGFSFVSTMQD